VSARKECTIPGCLESTPRRVRFPRPTKFDYLDQYVKRVEASHKPACLLAPCTTRAWYLCKLRLRPCGASHYWLQPAFRPALWLRLCCFVGQIVICGPMSHRPRRGFSRHPRTLGHRESQAWRSP
jgi:hypothetical protein